MAPGEHALAPLTWSTRALAKDHAAAVLTTSDVPSTGNWSTPIRPELARVRERQIRSGTKKISYIALKMQQNVCMNLVLQYQRLSSSPHRPFRPNLATSMYGYIGVPYTKRILKRRIQFEDRWIIRQPSQPSTMPPPRSSCFNLLLLLAATTFTALAAELGGVLADQAAVPSQEEIANLAGERQELLARDVDDNLLDGEEAIVAAVPVSEPDTFLPMDARSDEVVELVKQFMEQYEEEVGRTALKASVLQVLKAEKTEPREEVQEVEVGTGHGDENNVELVATDVSQLMRVFLLVDYGFQSSMMDAKRPYVSVLRLTMDCANDSVADEEGDVECDLLEHLDLPRHKGQVGKAIQRTIADAAPASFLATHSLHVKYDAVELQDIATDDEGDAEAMTYVRYRVADSSGKFGSDDCMLVVLQARAVNTLMYTDTVCFDSAAKSVVMAAYEYASNNLPVGALIFAAVCGAVVAAVILVRHRRKNQRFGYSYVRSKAPSHVPTQGAASGFKYVDAESPAIAC
ncbi:hypothetical protein PHYPSEUDO_007232 [Phytophthora pseudosyringae]|uniref:Uncharacterized protein n=1 Tax=Phytophthora pseudosyringae TaxID=221518 RepID=A0A8T1VH52_9STRA|nr:hypothetical protein PHYPSEUDO_007232 [Phytophthora pseudosyringae]